jgi:class 3 adenylate cyclase
MDQGPVSAEMRHEIRNLINHIVGSAQLLLEEVGDLGMADLVRAMESIRSDGRETLSLAEQLFGSASTANPAAASARDGLAKASSRILQTWGIVQARLRATGHADLMMEPDPIGSAAQAILAYATSQTRLAGRSPGAATPELAEVPRVPASAPAPTAPGGELGAEDLQPSRVLVVDDNPANRGILARRLERLGYEALKAADGRTALEILATTDVDLVLLDMMMPGLSGFDVLDHRRADPRLRDIPFIVISALDESESVVRCIEKGAEDYLLKPFDPVLLQARVSACIEKKRLRDQQQRYLATIETQATELTELNRTLEARVAAQVKDIERLRRLQRFLPPQIAEAIISEGEDVLEPHRRDITVAFCDLRGFTAFAEAAEPEDVMRVLREYHEAVGDLIFQLEGTLEHFAGDGIMVFFNDPVPCSDAALRAVRMGLGIRERVNRLAAEWHKRGHELGFGMGISMGYATMGPIGFEGRYDYAAIGSVANLAARLCGEAESGQILVSERVCTDTEGIVEYESIGEMTLKGFRRPVAAFNVVRDIQGWSLASADAHLPIGHQPSA